MTKQNNVRYLWYITTAPPTNDVRCYYRDGQWFGAYLTEPDHDIIDQYNMQYVGMGDELFPETYNREHV